ncbi:5'/3'-nucleotidase SurE [Stakelama tenebrarum]|uniref:5'-nucleotidase SurE n=1 Tax=Stakelama tenebrarum TaxID=2711215 RepID=A0A6G6Y656_9SPHN|nr:5'/3'-nucleotidase SurE [Sphingosinithalassobacter tenebrarum]QIG80405.1 5'/3'-nucleotidase SurE [Sphingosinithalassobacter tenebrarum]
MRVLLTNDDGYHARGLAVLEEIAAQFADDIWVVAPADEQSGAGHSLTLTRPLRIRQFGEKRFAVSGTPTDAVMMALAKIMKDNPPDLILSGVNRGANLAEDVTYSGTVSAAMEGALAGVRSIALSQVYSREGMGDTVPFAAAREWGAKVIAPLLDMNWAPRTLINVNFPALPPEEIRGIRVVTQGLRDYGRLQIVTNRDPRGFEYHWFALGPTVETPAHSTDLEAIQDSKIAVTPLHLDLTHRDSLDMLTEAYR